MVRFGFIVGHRETIDESLRALGEIVAVGQSVLQTVFAGVGTVGGRGASIGSG